MRPLSHVFMGMTGVVVIGAALLCVDIAQAQPVPGAKSKRPAAAGPSPEEAAIKQLPPPAKPEEIGVPSAAEMEQHCMKNAKCAAKLQQAKQGKRPAKTLPAATEPSPEEKFQKSLSTPAQGIPPARPRSHVPSPVDRFFSWLNPFHAEDAWAQTGYNVTLTPEWHTQLLKSYPFVSLGLYGGYASGDLSFYVLPNYYATTNSSTDKKPFMLLKATLPAEGYYLIDVSAYASFAKLRHLSNGPILDTWDYRTGCSTMVTCHYVSVEYYAAGKQYWYFWVDPTHWGTYIYSVTIKSYP